MDENLGADLELSHGVLNYLHACSQGAFAGLNMLSQLGYLEFNPDDLSKVQSNLQVIGKWSERLWKGMPILSVGSRNAQTPDAKECLALTVRIRQDIWSVVNRVEKTHLHGPDLTKHVEDTKYLMGAYTRFAYTHENFIKGLIEFGKNFTMPDLVTQYTPLLPQAEQNIEAAHLFFDIFTQAENVEQIFYRGLYEESLFLPGVFRTQIHDLTRYAAVYKGELTYELCEIPSEEAAMWSSMGVDPVVAGYWRAYSLLPSEAYDWTHVGISDPRTAFFWKIFRFTAAEAIEWAQVGFQPPAARDWADSNFSPEEAIEAVQKGAKGPADLIKQ